VMEGGGTDRAGAGRSAWAAWDLVGAGVGTGVGVGVGSGRARRASGSRRTPAASAESVRETAAAETGVGARWRNATTGAATSEPVRTIAASTRRGVPTMSSERESRRNRSGLPRPPLADKVSLSMPQTASVMLPSQRRVSFSGIWRPT